MSTITMSNRNDYFRWINPKIKAGFSFVYTKGNIEGFELPINMSIKCVETNEVFHFIWKQDSAMIDTDSCSFGELE